MAGSRVLFYDTRLGGRSLGEPLGVSHPRQLDWKSLLLFGDFQDLIRLSCRLERGWTAHFCSMSFAASIQAAYAHPGAGPWLRRGQHLEAQGDVASLVEAVKSYDHALALFQGDDLRMRRGRSLAWMNRGSALHRQNSAHAFADAVRSYEEAIRGLETELGDISESFAISPAVQDGESSAKDASTVSAELNAPRYHAVAARLDTLAAEDPLFLNSLGAAWMNRGVSLQQTRDEASLTAAVASHEHALALLTRLPVDAEAAFLRNLAAAWLNLADALLDTTLPSRHERAARAAREALQRVTPLSSAHLVFADLDLKARRALVVALGEQLFAADGSGHPARTEIASEASDVIDEGMALGRAWVKKGFQQVSALVFRLFCMGCQFYRMYQPQFLGEFIEETVSGEHALPGIEDFRLVAQQTLVAAEAELAKPRVWSADDPQAAKRMEAIQRIRETREWLEGVVKSATPTPA